MDDFKIDVKLQHWYGIPIWNCILNHDTDELEKFCFYVKNKKITTTDPLSSIKQGWQSHYFYKTDKNNKQLTDLLNSVEVVCQKIFTSLNTKSWLKYKSLNYWINICDQDHYHVRHIHSGSVLSCVFYVKAPEKCGDIIFHNSNDLIQYWWNSYFEENNSFYSHPSYTPIENGLIVFPSWLAHSVEPNKSNKSRISIAFNVGLQEAV